MSDNFHDFLIIGAGMAGLACATRLKQAGHSVHVLDKGRGPGGRMAVRRADVGGKTVSFDHGAQYFTARDKGFRKAVSAWEANGAAAVWSAASDGEKTVWVGTPGMNGPIRAMADELSVDWATRAEALERGDDGWTVKAGDTIYNARTVLVAIPAEQTAVLLETEAAELAAIANGVRSEPCWAAMAAFDRPLDFAEDCLREDNAPIAWAARNSAKPDRKGGESWVLHASPQRSREILDLAKEDAGPLLLRNFFEQTGVDPVEPVHLAAHRWLYARPDAIDAECARYDAEARIGIAGDYLHSPRVEGAWISGRALADSVLRAV